MIFSDTSRVHFVCIQLSGIDTILQLKKCKNVTLLFSFVQIYPTSVRTTGVGVASAVGRIAGMICPVVAVQLISGCEMTAAIVLFEAVAIVSGVGALLFPLETKGRKLTDIVSS